LPIGGPWSRRIHRREDGTIPVVFSSSPASLNRMLLTRGWRRRDPYKTSACLMAQCNHASDTLGAMTRHRGTMIPIESACLHVRMLMSRVMPPRLQTIHTQVRRLMGWTNKDRQGVPSHIEQTTRDTNGFDLWIMVIRFSGCFCPIFPAARAMPNCALRLTLKRKTPRFLVLIGSLIGMMPLVKYRIRCWHVLQRLSCVCFCKRSPHRLKRLPLGCRLGSS
jgi:hypothetical protein